MNQSGRMEKVRDLVEQIIPPNDPDCGCSPCTAARAALAEVEEWEAMLAAERWTIAQLTPYVDRAEAAEAELAIEREANPNRVVCPKCQANLPCESCKRYSVQRDELESEADRLKAALKAIFLDPLGSHGAKALARETLGIPYIAFASPEEMLSAARAALAPADRNTT